MLTKYRISAGWVAFLTTTCMILLAMAIGVIFKHSPDWVVEEPGVIRYRATNWRVERTKNCCTAFDITHNKLVVEGCNDLWTCQGRVTALIGERQTLGEEQ